MTSPGVATTIQVQSAMLGLFRPVLVFPCLPVVWEGNGSRGQGVRKGPRDRDSGERRIGIVQVVDQDDVAILVVAPLRIRNLPDVEDGPKRIQECHRFSPRLT